MAKNDNNNNMDDQNMDDPQSRTKGSQKSQQDNAGMKGGAVGGNIRDYLGGLDFPASRDEVVDYVAGQGASELVIISLASMPDQDFQSPDEIDKALSHDNDQEL